MRVGLLREEQLVAEQEIERKTKDVLERLKNATEELKSLEADTMIERNVLVEAEARAGIARRKITQLELCSQSVRKEILEFEGNLAILVMTRFGERLQVRVSCVVLRLRSLISLNVFTANIWTIRPPFCTRQSRNRDRCSFFLRGSAASFGLHSDR